MKAPTFDALKKEFPMNWNEQFARKNAGKMIRVNFCGIVIRGRVVGFSNDRSDISEQKVLCVTKESPDASSRIAPFHKAKRSYTQLWAPLDPNDHAFTFHKYDNEIVVEDDAAAPEEVPVSTRDFTAEELKLSAKDFAEMFAGAYVQHCASGRRYFVGAYRSERVVLSSLKGGKLDEVYWTPVCENPNAGETISVCNMASLRLELLTDKGLHHRARTPLRKPAGFPSIAAAAGNPDAKAWQDAWNAKFKTYNRMTSFLANLSMKNFPLDIERERREIIYLAMKEIDPKAVEKDSKAYDEMIAKIKDR